MKIDSLINYIGHKSKIVDKIKPYFPQTITGTFYDCFAGSCVVGLNVNYPRVKFVEYNTHLSQLYQDLTDPQFKSTLTALITQYGLTNSSVTPRSQYLTDPNIGTVQWMGKTIPNLHLDQLNKAGYTQLLKDFNQGLFTGLTKSAAYMTATIYGRNSSVATRPDLTLSGGIGPLDFSKRCSEKLDQHVAVLSPGRHSFITSSYDAIKPGPDDFVYCDPPYLATGYRYSGWEEADERALLDWLDQLPCPWALSNTLQSGNRVNQLLIDFSKRYTVIPIDKQYRKWGGSGTDTHAKKTKINREVLILNYKPTLVNGLVEFE
jgi:site-specific DNA-adenine methylase